MPISSFFQQEAKEERTVHCAGSHLEQTGTDRYEMLRIYGDLIAGNYAHSKTHIFQLNGVGILRKAIKMAVSTAICKGEF